MSTAPRRRRRRWTRSLANILKKNMAGIVFLIFGVIIVTVTTYAIAILPESYLYVSNGTIGVSSTLPQGASGVSNKLILGFLGWAVGILFTTSALARLGLRI